MRILLCKGGLSEDEFKDRLKSFIGRTRFRIGSLYSKRVSGRKYCALFIINEVRLKNKRPYFGFGAMAGSGKGAGPKIKQATYLQGVDWIEFNDLLNDLCDKENVSSRIWTGTCLIRDGMKRRIRYSISPQGSWHFMEPYELDGVPSMVDVSKSPILPFSSWGGMSAGEYRGLISVSPQNAIHCPHS